MMEDFILRLTPFDNKRERNHEGPKQLFSVKGNEVKYRAQYTAERKDDDTEEWEHGEYDWNYSYRTEDIRSSNMIWSASFKYWYVIIQFITREEITLFFSPERKEEATLVHNHIRKILFGEDADTKDK